MAFSWAHIDMDFYVFFYAALWALGASVAFARLRNERHPAWKWLGWAWAARSLAACLTLLHAGRDDAPWLAAGSALVACLSSVCLLWAAKEFVVSKRPARSWYVAALGIGLFSAAALKFTSAPALWVKLLPLTATGMIFSCALWNHARQRHSEQHWLQSAALGVAANSLCGVYATLIQLGFLSNDALGWTGSSVERALEFASLLFSLVTLDVRASGTMQTPGALARNHGGLHRWSRILLILGLSGLTWLAAGELSARHEANRKAQIMTRTRLAAGAVPRELLRELTWSDRDLESPAYQKLKHLMMSLVQSDHDLRFVLLGGVRADKSYFLVDSEDPHSKDYSPPGQLYEEADQSYISGMTSRQPFLLGPVTDRWGTWMIASVPLLTENGIGINAELDITAADWAAALHTARLPAFLLGFSVIVAALVIFHAKQSIGDSLAMVTWSEEQKNTIIESSPDAVYLIGRDRKYITANRNGLGRADLSLEDLCERHFEEIWPRDLRETLRKAGADTLGGRPTELEVEYLDGDSRLHAFRVATNPIRDPQAATVGFVALCCDITERKQAERALRDAKEAAESASRAKSDFLAVVSHEIRTPLGAVIGLLDLLRRHPGEAERKRYTVLAQQSAESLLHILNDILDAAKVESGKMMLEAIPFAPADELTRVLEGMRVRAQGKGLALGWTFAADLPRALCGDPTRLKQVVGNLVSNAIKFTAEGRVDVALDGARIDSTRYELRIQVSDTGIGMAPEVQSRLFAKFEQADASTTRKFGGTGLGLAIVKGIVDSMGGKIAVQSKPRQGTTFTVTIPVGLATETMLEPVLRDEIAVVPHCPKLTLLYAEDDAVNREYMGDALKLLGHSVDFAENGRAVIEKLAAKDYHAILMDNRMPVMDGFQATRAIRDGDAGDHHRHIYIIAVTANASGTYRNQCIEAGMNDYLTKPTPLPEMDAALCRAWKHRSSSQPPVQNSSRREPPGLSVEELLASVEEAVTAQNSSERLIQPSAKLTQLYLEEAPRRLAEMRAGYADRDLTKIAHAAHVLKGNSRYAGADDVAKIATEVLRAAEAQRTDAIESLVSAAESAFDKLKPELLSRVNQGDTA